MDYKDLALANEKLKTTNIKGKDYTEVNERIKAFRYLYSEGSIETEIVSFNEGTILMKAIIKDNGGKIIGVGHAYEKENSSLINKTSFVENCETSAVGRALGMVGIGINTAIASFEEVKNAVQQQLNEDLVKEAKALNIDLEKVAAYYKVKGFNVLTDDLLKEAIEKKKVNLGVKNNG